MKADNIFPYQMHICRPKFVVETTVPTCLKCRIIVDQSIKPNINDMLIIKRNWNTPIECCPGNTKVIEALFDEIDHFIAAAFRSDKIRILFNKFEPTISIFAHFEEIAFFFHHLYRLTTIWTNMLFAYLQLSKKSLTGSTIPTRVLGFVDISLIIYFLEKLLAGFHMVIISSTDKMVIIYFHFFPQGFKIGDDFIYKFFWLFACFGCTALNLLPMLIRTS